MLLHSTEGTHRLELPVSRTTLKVWGGVPMVISEKSVNESVSDDQATLRGSNIHWAFAKLETGTGWMPSDLGTLVLKMASARDSGREAPMYF